MDVMPSHTFRAVSYPWRLYAGVDALRHLAEEVRRHKAQRAFVVCGQTVAHKTNLLALIKVKMFIVSLSQLKSHRSIKILNWKLKKRQRSAIPMY